MTTGPANTPSSENPPTNRPEDRRQFTRIEFEAEVTLEQEGRSYSTQLQDISVNGLLATTPTEYHIRTDIPCNLQVKLSENAVINMQASLVHSSSQFLGFHCVSMDMESVVHLRRLVEINLDDPHASERVLSELLKRRQGV
jgi:hypothetical protein